MGASYWVCSPEVALSRISCPNNDPGDKDNHVASIHLAQMMYIWPYFLFFSAPILYPIILNTLIQQNALPAFSRRGSLRPYLPRIAVIIPVLALMLATVHFNTIVHPFTLADNRHYMFYVFRILRRHPLIKYATVPIYLVSGWTCLTALASPNSENKRGSKPEPRESKSRSGSSPRVSFILVWLLTTTLSLSTAPLVEPRYFILPWMTWRMQIASSTSFSPSPSKGGSKPIQEKKDKRTDFPLNSSSSTPTDLDLDLWLETAWFLAINAATCYMFLYRGFEWPQEPGKVQRFLW